MRMLLSLCGGWGMRSHFRVQPNHCVKVMLRCVMVGVVTKKYLSNILAVPELNYMAELIRPSQSCF